MDVNEFIPNNEMTHSESTYDNLQPSWKCALDYPTQTDCKKIGPIEAESDVDNTQDEINSVATGPDTLSTQEEMESEKKSGRNKRKIPEKLSRITMV